MKTWLQALGRRLSLWNRRRLHRRQSNRLLSYEAWCAGNDTVGALESGALRARLAAMSSTPQIAIVTPVGQASALRQALASQMYLSWTVVEADRPADALSASDAPWMAFTDIDDHWREHALLLLAEAALQVPDAVLIYADEDRLDEQDRRHDPRFKPDWNPYLMLSIDAVGRPALWRRSHLLSLERPVDPDRHALALHATHGVARERIVHVPHVLLHRRRADEQNSRSSAQTIQAHLDRAGIDAKASEQDRMIRLRFALPTPPPWVTVIIPTRNGLELLSQCVDSVLKKTDYDAFDIVIVDNGSDDPACLRWLDRAERDARVSVRSDGRPFNFSALNNAAVAHARGELVAMLNNDTEVITPGWLAEMASLAIRPDVGAVGARLWYSDRTLQHGGVVIGIGQGAGHVHKRLRREEPGSMGRAQLLQSFSAVTAACLLVRRTLYEQVGGLDEQAFAIAFNDVDFCLKLAAAGYWNLWTPHAELYHHESVSRGSDRQAEKKPRFLLERDRFRARWSDWIRHDPAYNPNLSLDHEHFGFARSPRVDLIHPWFADRLPWSH